MKYSSCPMWNALDFACVGWHHAPLSFASSPGPLAPAFVFMGPCTLSPRPSFPQWAYHLMDSARLSLQELAQQPDLHDSDPEPRSRIHAVTLEPMRPEDDNFVFEVFASTRADELALTGWGPEQKNQFLRMQFAAQKHSYEIDFPQLEHWIIHRDGVPAGRMMVDRSEHEILLVDLALLPQDRGLGLGSLLMAGLIEEASCDGKSIRLHVERFNPALQWYERLQFKVSQETEVYLELIWKPGLGPFRNLVLRDPSLQEVLLAFSDQESFVQAMVELGQTRRYSFGAEEVRAAMNAGSRAWIERSLG
jgi:ribosomal protein S18 acetylase RimI-like enzyme